MGIKYKRQVPNMDSPGAAGRRRGTSRSNVEDQALDQIAKEVSLIHLFFTFVHISEATD